MNQTTVDAFLLGLAPDGARYYGVGRSLMDEIASEYWADRGSPLAEAYVASARRGARYGHVFTSYADAAAALPLLERHLGSTVVVIGVSSDYLASVLSPSEESIEMVLLGYDVVSVGEWSLLQEIMRVDLSRDLERDHGVSLNRSGLLDRSDEEAVRSVEQVYRAAAEQNRVEPTWDPEVGIIECVAVLIEPRFLVSGKREE